MSQLQAIINIAPPRSINSNNNEFFEIKDFVCPYCNGSGGFGYSDYMSKFKKHPDDPDWKICPACKGEKKVKAEINVKWTPNK